MNREALITPQPMPVPGDTLVKEEIYSRFKGIIQPLVIEDCIFKMEASEEKYGSALMTKNGRIAALDAYTDLIDTINYLVQEYLEAEPVEKVMISLQIYRLSNIAGGIRYRLEKKGILSNEQR